VVLGLVVLLVTERVPPPVAILGAVITLLVAGVITPEEAFSGFSNAAPITVAALYVLAGAAERTRMIERLASRSFLASATARVPGERGALIRILLPTAGVSAFLNNTPIVAMVAPGVIGWARRVGRSPSRYLMPVSFAAILGGTITVIGTSTNLVVSGLLEKTGEDPIGLFEIGKAGLPLAIAGLATVIVLAPRLLPDRRAPSESLDADSREFTVEMLVGDDGTLAGRTVVDAGLRNLEGVFLVEIERDGRRVTPVGPNEVLARGDRLLFAGNVSRILDLQKRPGLTSAEVHHFSAAGTSTDRRLYEAVVAEQSALAGSTLKDVGFRARYGAAVLAIHRAGGRVSEKLGSVVLRPGDVLLILADRDFRRRSLDRRDFLVVAPLSGEAPPREEKAWIVAALVAALLALVTTGVLDIVTAALLAALAVVLLRVLTPSEARDAVDLNVIVLIAASFGLGEALSVTGLAANIADLVVEPFGGMGDVGLLLGIIVTTVVLTELITNNAAAVLMFPIAMATAAQAGLDPRPFAIGIAMGASASFLTPIGYQTNTMVYGMGGYRFGDFARLGFPLTIILIIVATVVIPLAWPLRG